MNEDVRSLLLVLVDALRDGKISAAETADILNEVVDIAQGDIPDLVEWLGDLFRRDRDELLEAAAKHEAKGHDKRAARLREKAATR